VTTTDLQSVYRERVLEHSKHPHNFYRPKNYDYEAVGFNPLCGDKITVFLTMEGSAIKAAAFEGTGCAISIASASMITDALIGCSPADAQALLAEAAASMSSDVAVSSEQLADLKALEGVRQYPSRVKCATLAWNTLTAALEGNNQQVTTE
jgi:nitrogen fixation NifU-like protein